MAMIIKTFAAIGFVSHWIGSLTRCMFISIELIIPSVANKLLKIMEYATSDVTHGKKIYPNDKCPCGSGNKSKQCCGRK